MNTATSSRIISVTAVGLTGLLIWAGFAEIDQISRAGGQVIPMGSIQIVQSNDGGIITELPVHEGDVVHKGQTLAVLDRVKLEAAVSEAKSKVAALEAQKIRIEAELFSRPLKFPSELQEFPEFMANERELYTRRHTAQTQDIAAMRRMLVLVRRELDMNQPLLAYGDVSRADILRLERSVTDIEAQIAGKQNRYFADLQAQYTQCDQELASSEQLLKQRQASLDETVLKAPTDGIVKNVHLKTLGGVLRPGDAILEIVPTGGALIVEAKVSPRDIAYVHIGQTAGIKFDAYDPSIYGSASGKVTYISPDTFIERRESGSSTDQIYYRVHISLDTRPMHSRAGEKILIQPGMTSVSEIRTGHNTVLNYLFKPITKTLADSFGER